VQFESGVRARKSATRVRGVHLVARIRQSGLLVVVMFRVDATMRPLLMTFESRRVTLNGGDANFQSSSRSTRRSRDRQTVMSFIVAHVNRFTASNFVALAVTLMFAHAAVTLMLANGHAAVTSCVLSARWRCLSCPR
jgi:hypothetical protein